MLDIRLLGEQHVSADGVRLELQRSTRTLGLLGFLVVHGGAPQLRQHLAGTFWPDSTESQARTNLRRELHQLRASLPDPERYLAVDDTIVCWRADAPCVADVTQFLRAANEAAAAHERGDEAGFVRAADHAVRVYGGELLPGLYDDWVLTERDRLRGACVQLLDRLAQTFAGGDDPQRAIGYARQRVALEPLEEAGYATLLRLQARAGDRAAALRTFHSLTAILERELGVAPSDETVALYEQLFPQRPRGDQQPAAQPHAAPLTGRAEEMRQLRSMWARPDRAPRITVLAGEAGVGKTRVAAEFAAAVERSGGRVARARCFPSRGRLALGPVAEWLRSAAVRPDIATLDAAWRAEVGRLLPEFAAAAERPRPTPLADGWQRRRFFEALARGVLATDRATLLVLDDLQWCDGDTLSWLELLVHLEPAVPLLVVATLRTEEVADDPELVAWCRRLQAAGRLDEVELLPLAADEIRQLAGSITGRDLDDAEHRRLVAQTGGFPLFVIESLREDAAGVPRTDAVLAGRLARLSPAGQQLAGLAAAIGRDFTLDLLAAAGDAGDEDALMAAVDELWRQRMLREHSATTYDFAHDLLRDAAYERLTPPHRRLLHRRVATALERTHADQLDAVAAQIADQYARGGYLDEAIGHHRIAAQTATAVFAHEDAIDHYERALELLGALPAGRDRERRELELRESLAPCLVAVRGYAAPEVGTTLQRMVELAEGLGDEAIAIRTQVARAGHHLVEGRIHEVERLTAPLVPRAAGHADQVGHLSVARGWSLMSSGRLEEAEEHLAQLDEQTEEELNPLGFPIRVMGLGWRAHTYCLLGRTEDGMADADAGIALAQELDRPFSRALALGYAAVAHRILGDVQRTVELATSVVELCERYEFSYYLQWGRILQGWAAGGRRGEKLVRTGLAGLETQHAGVRRPFWLAQLAEVVAARGAPIEAAELLTAARAWADDHGDRWWVAELWRLNASLHPDGDPGPLLQEALRVAHEQGAVLLELRAATDLARHWRTTGRTAAIPGLLEPIRARAGGCPAPELAAADALIAAPN